MFYIQMIHEDGTVLHFEAPICGHRTVISIAEDIVHEVQQVPGPDIIGVCATTLN